MSEKETFESSKSEIPSVKEVVEQMEKTIDDIIYIKDCVEGLFEYLFW